MDNYKDHLLILDESTNAWTKRNQDTGARSQVISPVFYGKHSGHDSVRDKTTNLSFKNFAKKRAGIAPNKSDAYEVKTIASHKAVADKKLANANNDVIKTSRFTKAAGSKFPMGDTLGKYIKRHA